MTIRHIAIGLASFLGVAALGGGSVQALTMKECSAKYKAAQTAGTLNGAKWNDFRKTECAAGATAAPASAAPATPAAAPPPAAAAKPAAAPKPTAAAPAPAPTMAPAASNATFPSAVSAKYSSESAGKARMHTCLDQYNANKAAGGNGELKWIQKGGGYYSECNKRLKG
jgi:hypothetical protein